MLQRIIAAVLIVGGLAAIGLGVASATVWRDSDTVVATTAYTGDGTVLVTDPGVLDLVAEDVTIRATAPGEQQVTLAIGREVDVTGWVGEDPHAVVTGMSDWDALTTRAVVPEPAEDETPAEGEAPTEGEAPADGESPAEGEAPAGEDAPAEGETPAEETPAEGETPAEEAPVVGVDPAGSDMWFEESTGAGSASLRWSDQPGRWQLLAAGVGEGAVAPTLELSWPREVETPFLWPGVIGGAVLLLLGLGIGAASLRPKRRGPTSGARRKSGETAATPAVPSPAAPASSGTGGPADGEALTDTAQVRMLTRRELREREEAERLAQQQARPQKPRRAWLTGQIPVVPRGERRPKTAAQPTVGTPEGHPTAQDSATTRADAWRRAWGFTPTGTSAGTSTDAPDETDDTKDTTR